MVVVSILAFVGFYLLRLGLASEALGGGMQALALLVGLVLFVVVDARLHAGSR
jgi:membrane-bound ClpP family serine protease